MRRVVWRGSEVTIRKHTSETQASQVWGSCKQNRLHTSLFEILQWYSIIFRIRVKCINMDSILLFINPTSSSPASSRNHEIQPCEKTCSFLSSLCFSPPSLSTEYPLQLDFLANSYLSLIQLETNMVKE